MNPAILNNQFVQVALPIVLTIFIAAWMNGRAIDGINKRIDDVNRRFDDLRSDMNSRFVEVSRKFDEVNRRLDKIDAKLDEHGTRVTVLEERTSPLGRRG